VIISPLSLLFPEKVANLRELILANPLLLAEDRASSSSLAFREDLPVLITSSKPQINC